ncbi:TetR-like C-terminal domain-containing protein [Streptomyces sp. NPDC020362]|uniref:TetR-like C-terminal domain-containing protein n=1 Tax=Streptomyces sp. NPDC020362 TaxID=3154486 RepID=UPI0033D00D80
MESRTEQKPARVRIVDAAHDLMLDIGLAVRPPSRLRRRRAGWSEAALCTYFTDEEELLVTVPNERLLKLGSLLGRLLEEGVGNTDRTVEENLTDIAHEAALFTEVFWAALHGLATLPRAGRLPPGDTEPRAELLVDRLPMV